MFLHEAKQILRTYLLLRPCSHENSKKVFSRSNLCDVTIYVQVLSSICIPTCSYYIYYCSLPLSPLASQSSLLKVPNIKRSIHVQFLSVHSIHNETYYILSINM